jgi:hypothetical protein
MGWMTRVKFPVGAGIFFSLPPWAQSPIQWVLGALPTLGVKWPGHEADCSPLSSAKVKNTRSYPYTTQICLHDLVLKQEIGPHGIVLS